MRKCDDCNETLNPDMFHKKGKNKEGTKRYRNICKKCDYVKYGETRRKNRAKYAKNNPEKVNKQHNNYVKKRRENDADFKLKLMYRNAISRSVYKVKCKKDFKSETIIGCDFNTFKSYIEKHFKAGMTWDNYGEWHLDHIMPLATAKNKEDIIRLNHYTNLRPLWAIENKLKSDKIVEHQVSLPI